MASGTLSALVRIPVGDFIFPPLLLTLYYLGEKSDDAKILCGGRIIIRWRNIYQAVGAGGPNVQKQNHTVPTTVPQCPKFLFPDLNTLRDRSISLYITKDTILIHCRTYLNTLIPYPLS